MKIKLKLFATLTDYLPQPAKKNEIEIEVAANATVGSVIERYNLPPKLVHLVLVNGLYIYPHDRTTQNLNEGDVLAIWPPIAGG
ncbi:MAG: MoaD/ThiS family protein [Pseudomonadota bacterium]|nr:MoaD/ThiS family protein [Pseudomonadota bacterium]